MRRVAFGLVILAGAAVSGGASKAQVAESSFLVQSTGDLVALCSSRSEDRLYTAAQNFCHGYAVGIYQGTLAQQSARTVPLFCAPAQMPTRAEAIASFVQWAQASPARLQMAAADGVASFLAERLPCAPGRKASR